MYKMGSIFPRNLVSLAIAVFAQTASGQILLPEHPAPAAIPRRSSQEIEQDRKQLDRHVEKRMEKDGLLVPKEDPPGLKLKKALLEETLKPKALDFAILGHLTYNMIKTTGSERKNYTPEPSVGLNLIYRVSQNTKPEDLNVWAGFRAQSFTGEGEYKDVHGHFSFLYFGPTVGVGKVSPGSGDVGVDDVKDAKSITKALTARHGFFALTGLAAQTRQGKYEENKDQPNDDLNSKTVAFDSPGLFAEVYYTYILYNALSYNAVAGLQAGKQKLFFYGGVGIGLWH